MAKAELVRFISNQTLCIWCLNRLQARLEEEPEQLAPRGGPCQVVKVLCLAFPLDPSISRWEYPQKGVAEKVKIGVIPFMGSFMAIVDFLQRDTYIIRLSHRTLDRLHSSLVDAPWLHWCDNLTWLSLVALGIHGSYEMWVKDAWLPTNLESNLTVCDFKERLSQGRGQAALSDFERDDSPSVAPFCPCSSGCAGRREYWYWSWCLLSLCSVPDTMISSFSWIISPNPYLTPRNARRGFLRIQV